MTDRCTAVFDGVECGRTRGGESSYHACYHHYKHEPYLECHPHQAPKVEGVDAPLPSVASAPRDEQDPYEVGRAVGYDAGYENGRDNGFDEGWPAAMKRCAVDGGVANCGCGRKLVLVMTDVPGSGRIGPLSSWQCPVHGPNAACGEYVGGMKNCVLPRKHGGEHDSEIAKPVREDGTNPLEAEIERLTKENEELRGRVDALPAVAAPLGEPDWDAEFHAAIKRVEDQGPCLHCGDGSFAFHRVADSERWACINGERLEHIVQEYGSESPRTMLLRWAALALLEMQAHDESDDAALLCDSCGHWYDSRKGPCPDCKHIISHAEPVRSTAQTDPT